LGADSHVIKRFKPFLEAVGLTAFQHIWDHSPHQFVVFSHNFVSFGRKIKVDIDLETGESRAHAYSKVVNWRPIPLVSAGSRFDPRFSSITFCQRFAHVKNPCLCFEPTPKILY
jgi:hypothetical protein